MNYAIEERFVKTFCEKRIKDRIIFELKDEDKRLHGIGRFCHTTEGIIKKQYVLQESNKWSVEELLHIIQNISSSDKCYIIAFDYDIDGKEMSLKEGIRECFYRGMSTVLIVDEKTVIIKDEQYLGASHKYVLHKPL